MKKITIYTDGACSGNPGPGGWGAILEYKGVRKEISGGEAETTNNRMELMGIIRALEQLKEPCDITFAVIPICDGRPFQRLGPRAARPRLGKKRQKACAETATCGRTCWTQQAPHLSLQLGKEAAGHPENERCDELAVQAAAQYK